MSRLRSRDQTSQLLLGDITADLPARLKIPTVTLAHKARRAGGTSAALKCVICIQKIKEPSPLFQSFHVLLFQNAGKSDESFNKGFNAVLGLLAPMSWSEGRRTLTITKNSVMVTV